MKLYLVIMLATLLQACSQSNPNKNQKSVGELTYSEIVDPTMNGTGEPWEYHGESLDQDAIGSVSLFESEIPCLDEKCGKKVFITSSASDSITATTYSKFHVGQFDSYAARKFYLAPSDTQLVGCSHFCYNGESFVFDHKIIGAMNK